ncbi:hypothetical protein RFI_39325 [Reticulomyxa filosa]|uniref:Uncharacterized protein n=1 Tax=Reticulomyxa filosa TaxID=46433 RepID=X6LBR8_RETFI|nr:hypothetical protein RFI_39325 [Reticulomyxa filosa]|eukprot:ETN98189.1 hypothetical protein RFI_39325 [Reticulomyxa filosa]
MIIFINLHTKIRTFEKIKNYKIENLTLLLLFFVKKKEFFCRTLHCSRNELMQMRPKKVQKGTKKHTFNYQTKKKKEKITISSKNITRKEIFL